MSDKNHDDQILEQARYIEQVRTAEQNVERAKAALEQAENTLEETKKSRAKATAKSTAAAK